MGNGHDPGQRHTKIQERLAAAMLVPGKEGLCAGGQRRAFIEGAETAVAR